MRCDPCPLLAVAQSYDQAMDTVRWWADQHAAALRTVEDLRAELERAHEVIGDLRRLQYAESSMFDFCNIPCESPTDGS